MILNDNLIHRSQAVIHEIIAPITILGPKQVPNK